MADKKPNLETSSTTSSAAPSLRAEGISPAAVDQKLEYQRVTETLAQRSEAEILHAMNIPNLPERRAALYEHLVATGELATSLAPTYSSEPTARSAQDAALFTYIRDRFAKGYFWHSVEQKFIPTPLSVERTTIATLTQLRNSFDAAKAPLLLTEMLQSHVASVLERYTQRPTEDPIAVVRQLPPVYLQRLQAFASSQLRDQVSLFTAQRAQATPVELEMALTMGSREFAKMLDKETLALTRERFETMSGADFWQIKRGPPRVDNDTLIAALGITKGVPVKNKEFLKKQITVSGVPVSIDAHIREQLQAKMQAEKIPVTQFDHLLQRTRGILFHESKGDPFAVSETNCLGISQLNTSHYETAQINPFNPVEAIPLAIKYILELEQAFPDNEIAAITGYNAGEEGVYKAMEKYQARLNNPKGKRIPKDFRDFLRRAESRRYYANVKADSRSIVIPR